MIRILRQPNGVWRHVFMTLAAMAVALKVLIPPGFMASAPSQTAPFAIVLCTGQGAVTIQAGQPLPGHGEHDRNPSKTGHDAPCVFAGHGLGAPPPSLTPVGEVYFASYLAPLPTALTFVMPGRGLAAPPPPPTGPPSII